MGTYKQENNEKYHSTNNNAVLLINLYTTISF